MPRFFKQEVDLSQYQALVFDMDGTIVDSGQLHEKAWLSVLEKRNIFISREFMRGLAGVPTYQTIELVAQENNIKISENEIQLMMLEKEAFVDKHYTEYVKATDLEKIIKQYHKKLPMVVGTGASTVEAHRFLKQTGLFDYFDAIIGFDQVKNGKPKGDTFILAAQKIGINPVDCIVFEDAQYGFMAAHDANMDVVDVKLAYNIHNDYFL
ncbi:MAG: HAD-IA family hydrolase [Saccharospirillaceae bacterium]|nr:HAD-IA family hydrolase [Pseudomonadales bacterium]NRB81073.1 HAD-IA family hydrolase [Saccharospirillaceae bacterium]